MNKSVVVPFLTFGLSLSAGTSVALADFEKYSLDDRQQKSGLSGYVQLLMGGYTIKGLNSIEVDNHRIETLDARPKRYSEEFLLPLGQVNYNFSQSQTKLFIGTLENDVINSGAFIEIGVSHRLSDETILTASYGPKFPGLSNEVWQDPYLTGQKRERTDATLETFNLSAEYIFGSPWSIDYGYGEQSIRADRAGESLNSRLTSAEIKELQRSKKYHHTKLSLTLPLTDHWYFISGVSYDHTTAKGNANRSIATGIELTFFYKKSYFEFFTYVSLSDNQYHESNPVFGTKREDDSHEIAVGASYLKPFGWKNIKLDLIISKSRQDSNIHFYDTRAALLTAGLTFQF